MTVTPSQFDRPPEWHHKNAMFVDDICIITVHCFRMGHCDAAHKTHSVDETNKIKNKKKVNSQKCVVCEWMKRISSRPLTRHNHGAFSTLRRQHCCGWTSNFMEYSYYFHCSTVIFGCSCCSALSLFMAGTVAHHRSEFLSQSQPITSTTHIFGRVSCTMSAGRCSSRPNCNWDIPLPFGLGPLRLHPCAFIASRHVSFRISLKM